MDENTEKRPIPLTSASASYDMAPVAPSSQQLGQKREDEDRSVEVKDEISTDPPTPGILGSSLGKSLRRNLLNSLERNTQISEPAVLERTEQPSSDQGKGENTPSPEIESLPIKDGDIEMLLGRYTAAKVNSSLEKILRMNPRQRFEKKAAGKNQNASGVPGEGGETDLGDEQTSKPASSADMRKTASNMAAFPPKAPAEAKADKVSLFPMSSAIAGFAVVAVFAYGLLQPLGLRSEDLSEGTSLLRQGHVDRALVYFDDAVKSHPSADAFAGRAATYEKLGQKEKAFSDYESALKLDPENLDALLDCADFSLATKQYDKAISFYLQYLDLAKEANPNSAKVRAGLAEAYMGSGKYSRALVELNHIGKTVGGDPQTLFKIATCHYALRRYDLAKNDCSKLLALNPQSYDALLLRGRAYEKLSDNKNALADFDRAIAMKPQGTAGLIARGTFFANTGNVAKAFQDLNRALVLKPEDLKAYGGLVKANIASGQPLKGLQLWEDVSRNPQCKTDSSYYIMSGDIYALTGLYPKAVNAYRKALELEPGSRSSVALSLSECYGKQKDYKEAVLWASNALRENTGDAAAYTMHGEYSYLIGNKTTALADFSQAIELEPSYTNAYIQRGNYYLSEKNFYSAKEDFEAALQLQPSLTKLRKKIAFCQARTNLNLRSEVAALDAPVPDEITLTTEESNEIANANLAVLQKAGYSALSKGRVNYALAAFARAIKLNPNDPHSRLYMAHALLQAGYGSDALKQFYVLEQVSKVEPSTKIAFATALSRAGYQDDSQSLFDRIIATYTNDPKVLLQVAKVCADLDDRAQVLAACEAGTKCASREDLVEFMKIMGKINGPAKEPKAVRGPPMPS